MMFPAVVGVVFASRLPSSAGALAVRVAGTVPTALQTPPAKVWKRTWVLNGALKASSSGPCKPTADTVGAVRVAAARSRTGPAHTRWLQTVAPLSITVL